MSINIDFSEKLEIPLKNKPQPVHLSGFEIIVHSGILKKDGNKDYNYYLSDDLIYKTMISAT